MPPSEILWSGIREFEVRKLYILEDHFEIRHMKKKTLWGQKGQKTEHYCDKFRKEFKNFFLSRDFIFEAYGVVGARFQTTSKGSNNHEAWRLLCVTDGELKSHETGNVIL